MRQNIHTKRKTPAYLERFLTNAALNADTMLTDDIYICRDFFLYMSI